MKITIDIDITPGSYDLYDGDSRVGEAYVEHDAVGGTVVHIAIKKGADPGRVDFRPQPGSGRPSRTAFLAGMEWTRSTVRKIGIDRAPVSR